MKKKFVLTLALVLMVAVTLTAAPIELGGEFAAGRTFKFDPNSISANSSIELNKLSVSGDFWKISLDGGAITFGDAPKWNGAAEIYLDKALAAQGVDMGDLTLTLGVGNKTNSGFLHVYFDGDEVKGKAEMKGILGAGTTEVTVGYGSMLTVKAGLNFNTTEYPIALSAKVTPVDGVAVAAGFTNYAGALESKGALAASASVDVAALAGLDFGLSAYAYNTYMFDSKTNTLNVALKASFADIYLTTEMDAVNAFDTVGMFVKAEYKGIENVGMSAKLAFADLNNAKAIVSGDASYTMGGVKYKLAAKFDSSLASDKFSLSPSVTIAF